MTTDHHPADLQHRRRLMSGITQRRRSRHITQMQAARVVGVTFHAISGFDRGRLTNPGIDLVQRHCWTIRHTLGLRLHGLPDVDGDPNVVLWKQLAAKATDVEATDRYDRAAMLATLIAAREALGITQAGLSQTLGVHQSAIHQIENADKTPRLGTYQRYARGLGGAATYTLAPAETVTTLAA